LIWYYINAPLNLAITLRHINIPIITPIHLEGNLPIGRVIEQNLLIE